MNKIVLLDQGTINKIAAGEVVERPSAVVKELIENAMDAGANAITVEIKGGGIDLIRITDNGSGIPSEDIPVAFERHATSKIRSVEDLLTVSSLGFRGEALASISAVAQVELITKTRGALLGNRYVIEGGNEKDLEEIGCPEGTTFVIRNLFYNTPARKKFLKSAQTEAGYIGDFVERLALSRPDISFKFLNNNQLKLHTSGNGNLKDVIYHIYGREIAAELLEINENKDGIHIHGFIAKPIVSRGNRGYMNYFINGRYIKSNIISKGIEEGYKPYTMQHRYPMTALHFEMDSSLLDVNVHPTKMEVRFSDNQKIYQLVLSTISDLLAGKEMIPTVLLGSEKKEKKNEKKLAAEPFETGRKSIEQPKSKEEQKSINQQMNTEFQENGTALQNMNSPKNTSIENVAAKMVEKKGDYKSSESESVKKEASEALKLLEKFENIAKRQEERKQKNSYQSISEQRKIIRKELEMLEKSRLTNKQNKFEEALQPIEGQRNPKIEEVSSEMQPSLLKEDFSYRSNNNECIKPIKCEKVAEEAIEENSSEPIKKSEKITKDINKEEQSSITDQIIDKKNSEQISLFSEKLLDKEAKKHHHIIGQVFGTYWMVEYQDKLFMIDQHAAHEKVLFERTMKSMENKQFTSQLLNPPIILTLNMREQEALENYLPELTQLGFEIEAFGGREYSVRAIPGNLYGVEIMDFLMELIGSLLEEVHLKSSEIILEKVASMSCKAAVKGNTKLSYAEAEGLIDELMELENPYHCPHGRPVIVSMSKYELEKKFKRIL